MTGVCREDMGADLFRPSIVGGGASTVAASSPLSLSTFTEMLAAVSVGGGTSPSPSSGCSSFTTGGEAEVVSTESGWSWFSALVHVPEGSRSSFSKCEFPVEYGKIFNVPHQLVSLSLTRKPAIHVLAVHAVDNVFEILVQRSVVLVSWVHGGRR